MSKRVPVYLSEKELAALKKWYGVVKSEYCNNEEDDELVEKIKEILDTFKED
jgi:hypothetical protein